MGHEPEFASKGASAPAGVPVFDVDPYSDEMLADPYPIYDQMRAAGAIVWLSKYAAFFVTEFRLAREIAQNWQDFTSTEGIGIRRNFEYDPPRAPSLLLEADPPEHTRFRSIITRILSPAVLKCLRTQVEKTAEQFVSKVLALDSFDAFGDLVRPYIIQVVGDMVGLPPEGREHLVTFGQLALNMPGPANERLAKALANVMEAGTFDWVERSSRRDALAPGGFGAAVYEAVDDQAITNAEAVLLIRIFQSAAIDSTMYTLTNGLKSFVDNPDQWQLLVANPRKVRDAVEEVLRHDVAVQTIYRTATRDLELNGVQVPKGSKVGIAFAAANRDPKQFVNPTKFDIERRNPGHLAFSAGVHGCAGQMVARLEAECLFAALATRVNRFELSGAPVREINNALTSWAYLPIITTSI